MKRQILSLLLVLMLLSTLPVPGVHAQPPETVSADVSANVLHLGGLLPEEPLIPRADISAVKQAIYEGLCARVAVIDISAYNVPASDISAIYAQVLNEHPDLFYVSGGFGWSSSGSYVFSVSPTYDSTYTDADVSDYENTVQGILGQLGSGWSAMEKLLFLHDYLVTHCEYNNDYQQNKKGYNAHDALVVGSAVCQGYTEAFCDLCRRCGIPCKMITSEGIKHAWNLVALGDEYFYIDCTWDDPANNWYEGYCKHSNFLLGKSALIGTKHTSTDWTDGSTNVYENDPSSTTYDGAWWSEVNTAVPIIGHIGAYTTNSDTANFYLRDMRTDSIVSYPLPASAVWPVFNGSGYWVGNYCSFAAMNGRFYFTLPTEIWSATTGGETASVYKLTQNELAQGYAYGIVADGNTLYYNVGQKAFDYTGFVRTALTDVGGPVTGESGGFSYEVLADGSASITSCTLTGKVTIPQTLDGYTVTNLASKLFEGKSGITAVTIPASVTYFGTNPDDNKWDYVFSYCYDLTRIDVNANNPSFCSVDGVLFSKDRKTLINYPCARAGKLYRTQAETICCTAFAANSNLKFLFLDKPNAWWYTYTFYSDPDLTVFYVPGGNAEQKADSDRNNGHVQDGANGNPWCYLESTASISSLPADLTTIESGAFTGTDIPWIIAPAGCTRIKNGAFADCALAYLQVGMNTVIEDGALAASVVVERK